MIVVTAPTGNIGRQVLPHLLASDVPVRVIARDPARLPTEIRERVEVVLGSHGDIDVVTKAFAGADAVFWLLPPNRQTTSLDAAFLDFTRPACEAFTSQGIQRVVGVSGLGRGAASVGNAGLVTASLAMDDLIASTGVNYRALTMPSFMDNFLWQVQVIKSQGMFFAPLSPDLKRPTCATRDIAAVAAELLLDDSWSGYDSVPVLGPEDLSNNDMARIMSEVLGRPIRFQQVSGEAYKAAMLESGMSEAVAQGMYDMLEAKENGLDNTEPRTPRSTTPTTFRQWCEEVLAPAFTSNN
ncbi:NAD(P)H-binding protein [Nocardia sp. CA-084685]|uniref:NAD(P)H-binding protein n=1 Tax=Nocardia sp. CA-084685 TaxID=3239970 RepID=UPI003D970EE8